MKTKKYYLVTYYSPGSFVSETSSARFKNFNLASFVKRAKSISERHGSKPYGFTVEEKEEPVSMPVVEGFKVEVEPNTLSSSGTYYITGNLIFYDDIKNNKEKAILASNLYNNSLGIGIENCNSWKFTGDFERNDFIVDWDGKIVRSGTDSDLVKYRNKIKKLQKEDRYKHIF